MQKSDLIVLHEMAEQEMDIRASPHFVSAKLAKGGGHITMGVEAKTIHDLALGNGDYLVILYVVDREQFQKLKSQ